MACPGPRRRAFATIGAMLRLLAAALSLGLAAPSSASAELVLKAVSWQIPTRPGEKPRGFKAIERWIQPASAKLASKPRVVVTVVNRGPKAAEGAVLRYSIVAKMARVAETGKEGVWTVPFYLNERRVARVGPNQVKDIPLNDLVLDVFLKKSFRAGYWPSTLNIQVMVEPRSGEGLDQRIMEQQLPVVAK